MGISTYKPLKEEDINLFKRFLKVFELSYTRYLDIEQAIAQARESQIQLALERVRARTMAMYKGEELADTAILLFEQLSVLGIKQRSCGFLIMDENLQTMADWSANLDTDGKATIVTGTLSFNQHPILAGVVETWKKREPYFIGEVHGDELQKYYGDVTSKESASDEIKQKVLAVATSEYTNSFYFQFGMMYVLTPKPLTEHHINIMLRFAKVLEQTYTRFLDLQKAEAQTKESQIQLALERVRARTMAMQKSDELSETALQMFEQVQSFGINLWSCGFNIWEKGETGCTSFIARGGKMLMPVKLFFNENSVLQLFDESRRKKEEFWFLELAGEDAKSVFGYVAKQRQLQTGDKVFLSEVTMPFSQITHLVNFSHGNLMFITIEPHPEMHDIFKRFGKVFEQTYTRFLDLQKAEAQAKEAQIEAALERVRSSSLAMHQSEDIQHVVHELYTRLLELNIRLDSANILFFKEGSRDIECWTGSNITKYQQATFPYADHDFLREINEAHENGSELFKGWYTKEKKDALFKYLFKETELKLVPADRKKFVFSGDHHACSTALVQQVGVSLNRYFEGPFSAEEDSILKRFSRVFHQAYTRFLDLQKAEAQAREAQIETALERVRSKTMAMYKHEDLLGVLNLLVEQLIKLGVQLEVANFSNGIPNGDWDLWIDVVRGDGTVVSNYVHFPRIDHSYFHHVEKNIETFRSTGKDLFKDVFSKEDKDSWQEYVYTQTIYKDITTEKDWEYIYGKPGYTWSMIFLKDTWVSICRYNSTPFSDEEDALFRRFVNAFGQAYTRFLDLKKAEAQAREGQIETALEKVRSRSLAVHKSDEFNEVIKVVFERLQELEIPMTSVSINIIIEGSKDTEAYICGQGEGGLALSHIRLVHFNHPIANDRYNAYKKGLDFFTKTYSAEEKNSFYEYEFKVSDLKYVPADIKKMVMESKCYTCSVAFTKNSMIVVNDFEGKSLSSKESDIVKRFARVFEQAYIRFLDLQKAEAQAREAQIEAALERIRARALAMHNSAELMEVASVLREQMNLLGQTQLEGTAVHLYDEDPDNIISWHAVRSGIASDENILTGLIEIPKQSCELAKEMVASFQNKKYDYTLTAAGKKLFDWIEVANASSQLQERKQRRTEKTFFHCSDFSGGSLVMFSFAAPSEEAKDLQRRAAKVFDLAYKRFVDLKKAEAQTREAQIQLALERVRARTMAMQKSDELQEIVTIVFDRLTDLDIKIDSASVIVLSGATDVMHFWVAVPGQQYSTYFQVPAFDNTTIARDFNSARKSGKNFTKSYTGKEKNEQWNYLFKHSDLKNIPDDRKKALLEAKAYTVSVMFTKNTALQLLRNDEEVFSENENKIFQRFANVFEQAYIRFLDLQKAEAQAREAKIEAALERIRSAAMAMHTTEGMLEVTHVLREQIALLGEKELESILIHIYHEDTNQFEAWYSYRHPDFSNNQIVNGKQNIDWSKTARARKDKEKYYENENDYTIVADYHMLKEWYEYLFKIVPQVVEVNDKGDILVPNVLYYNYSKISGGALLLITNTEASQQSKYLLKRAAKVFNLAYSRFLDLQKAEAQAREARIEAALERVRSRAMAMQTSEELNELISTVFTELTKLDLVLTRCVIQIYEGSWKGCRWWMANSEAPSAPMNFFVKYADLPFFNAYLKGWQERTLKWQYILEDENKIKTDNFLFGETELSLLPDFVIAGMRAPKSVYLNASFNNFGNLTLASLEPLSNDHFDILLRFAKVFDLTYTRFNDLKQAEEQARESQIELSLERVRAKTMAMHNSNDVAKTVATLFGEVVKLGIETIRCGIGIMQEGGQMEVWTAKPDEDGKADLIIGRLDMMMHPLLKGAYNSFQHKNEFYTYELMNDDLINYFTAINNYPDYPIKYDIASLPGKIIHSEFHFTDGALFVFSLDVLSAETKKIFKRFANVFGQTYRRYLDLQKAEAQVKEAQIETALEKVRSRSLAVHKSDEFKEVIKVVFERLQELGFQAASVSLNIFIKDSNDTDVFICGQIENGLMISHFLLPYFDSPIQNDRLSAQKNNLDFFTKTYNSEEKNHFYDSAFELPDLKLIPGEIKKMVYDSERYTISWALAKNSMIIVNDFGGNVLSENEIDIVKRFARVFEQAYIRFLDLQKAEAQAREAQIETTLERVRSRSMGMQKSEELKEVIHVVYEQFVHLNILVEHAGFIIDYKERDDMHIWLADKHEVPSEVTIPYFNSQHWNSFIEAKEKGKHFFVNHLTFEEKNKFYQDLFKLFPVPDEAKEYYFNCAGLAISTVLLENVGLYIENFAGIPYSDEENKILMRFGKVFQQTYTRFFDLKKAEAQARESQIQLALERARTQSMIMQHSIELDDTLRVFHEQVLLLGIKSAFSFLWLPDEEKNRHIFWAAWAENNSTGFNSKAINYPLDKNEPATAQCLIDWKSNEVVVSYHVQPDGVQNYFAAWSELIAGVEQLKPEYFSSGLYYVEAFMKYGCFGVMLESDLTEDEKKILSRFAIEFERAYTRFLDLQKAESQAREAQIQLALERVRARTMAMQKSDELSDTAYILFQQFKELGENPIQITIGIFNEEEQVIEFRITGFDGTGSKVEQAYNMDIHEPVLLDKLYTAWKEKKNSVVLELAGKDLRGWAAYRNKISGGTQPVSKIGDDERRFVSVGFFSKGFISFSKSELIAMETIQILERFAGVFDLTYTRFLDLQKAESSARKAQIEAALERVRARAMAMQKPAELVEVAQLLRKEMGLLGVEELETSSIYIHDETTGKTECWYAIMKENTQEKNLVSDHMTLDLNETWVGRQMLAFYDSHKKQISIPMKGIERNEWINYCADHSEVLEGFYGDTIPDRTYHLYKFSGGYMGAASPGDISVESWNLLQRATSVFSLAYTRFSDLIKAETNARDAVKQSALDRIRADIASMRTVNDLDRITPLIWNELTILGVPFIRCGVFIMNDEQQLIHTFLSTPDGKAIAAFHIPYNTPGNIKHVISHWHNNKNYIDHWDENAFTIFAETLVTQGALISPQQYLKTIPYGGFYLHFLPFLQGMLYVGNTTQLSEEEIDLIQSVADAFSTAYARYEDFNKLEAAKQQVEQTLTELKQTQQQLVQSEKMASLGELTAGIAHEIQNPLNFVNNFSEVNEELLIELIDEFDKGNAEEAKAIANDIKQNLEKINHHGKRADAIVKNMLQHSRKNSGQKEPTDINALCDEYLRLSFHGMRAKDKSFNADFKTEFDETIGKINIIPQNIGRVLLNLFNNAFYAVNERQKAEGERYKAEVSVQTKKLNDKVEIIVSDNGNGIQQNLVDKIFQPFFTTKPTGQGTGLGLSLAYDIITKEHNGVIKAESKEGEGSMFIIQLPFYN